MAIQILREEFEVSQQPTQDEIHEFAEYLGMDMELDKDLFYLAERALSAPLPDEWKPCKTEDDDVFFFNMETGESVWEHPVEKHFRDEFLRIKARRDAPVRIVTISCTHEADNSLSVQCISSFSGEELSSMEVRAKMRVRDFERLLQKRLQNSNQKVLLMLPCGTILPQEDSRATLASVFGLARFASEQSEGRD